MAASRLFHRTLSVGRKVSFTVAGDPVGKGQPRAFYKPGLGVRAFTPAKTRKYMDQVRLFAAQAIADQPPLSGPVSVTMECYLARPGRLVWKSRPMPAQLAPTLPDLSNIIKAVEDGINRTVIIDDRQIVSLVATKFYASGPDHGDPRPRVEITVEEI
jgi:Holliday junction resolvase RusA-like endonuclease